MALSNTRVHTAWACFWGTVLAQTILFVSPCALLAQQEGFYEGDRVALALRRRSLIVDRQPEGKRIAFIQLVREDVFATDELLVPIVLPPQASTWPNAFRFTTEEDVVRREVLLGVGDAYDAELVEEVTRNLRALGIFALVRIVAVRTENADSVGLVVYTRDIWSLRLELAFSGTGESFRLSVPLIERNLLGWNKQLSVRFGMDPKTITLGGLYADPRVLSGSLAMSQSFDVIVNRETGDTEGSQAGLSLGQPFRDLRRPWAFGVSAGYSVFVARSLLGSEVVAFRPGDDGGVRQCGEPSPECMRSVWEDRSVRASLSTSYRRGERYKQTFTLGAGVSDRAVEANAETALRPEQEEDFARLLLPRARRQIYPYAAYGLWLPDFVVFRNLATFGQSESVRVGPELSADAALPLAVFGSSSNSVRVHGGIGYVLSLGDALAEASVSAAARLEQGDVVDQNVGGVVRGVTPTWFWGRLLAYADLFTQRRDSANSQITLGGDNGLRGYASGALRVVGGSRVRASVEYRTLPLVFQSIHVGGVLFYDSGSVYRSPREASFHHSVGAGLRVLFPQFNQTPFRADVGLPLNGDGFAVLLSYGSAQALPITATDDAALAAQP